MSEPRESAVIVRIALPPALERLRRAYVPVASLGVPAHITLLYPFVAPERIDDRVVSKLRAVIGQEQAFDVELTTTRTFPAGDPYPGTTWLAPAAPEPFIRLTNAIWSAFPDHPPFEGAYEDIVPHLTIADAAARFEEVGAVARSLLPMRRRVEFAWLIVEGVDGRWRTRRRFRLAGEGAARS